MAELEDARRRGQWQIHHARQRIAAEEQIIAGWLQFTQTIGRKIYEHSREQGPQPSGEVGEDAGDFAPASILSAGG